MKKYIFFSKNLILPGLLHLDVCISFQAPSPSSPPLYMVWSRFRGPAPRSAEGPQIADYNCDSLNKSTKKGPKQAQTNKNEQNQLHKGPTTTEGARAKPPAAPNNKQKTSKMQANMNKISPTRAHNHRGHTTTEGARAKPQQRTMTILAAGGGLAHI